MGIKSSQSHNPHFLSSLHQLLQLFRVSHSPTFQTRFWVHTFIFHFFLMEIQCLPDFYIFTPFSLLEQSGVLGEDPESKNLSTWEAREKVGGRR